MKKRTQKFKLSIIATVLVSCLSSPVWAEDMTITTTVENKSGENIVKNESGSIFIIRDDNYAKAVHMSSNYPEAEILINASENIELKATNGIYDDRAGGSIGSIILRSGGGECYI